MKKVFIKYNPYKLITEITVDEKPLFQNSKLIEKAADGCRMQEWIEEMPKLLVEEYNDDEFELVFHGIEQDYDDILSVVKEAIDNKVLKFAEVKHIPAKESADKEKLIDDLFREIQKGPFEELKTEELKTAYANAKCEDFPVCVVATMSAGKSTLINSMLSTKLMPSKAEACTAIITRIKDNDNESGKWSAVVKDENENIIETHADLDLKKMTELNENDKVREICVEGDIPFVEASDAALVLIDTPGPNNARNKDHGKVQSEFLNKSSKDLVLYIMESTFGTDDDNNLLRRVADSMKEGGKQSKDRFIFVINKMDNRKSDDGKTEDTLARVRTYLNEQGIEKPNLFPVCAYPALSIRQMLNGDDLDEDTIEETEVISRKLNRNEDMHFEQFATLPSSVKKKIDSDIDPDGGKGSLENALIHTGIPSVEQAIRQYVTKYAKTKKVKSLYNSFRGALDGAKCMEKTKKDVASNRAESEKIVKQIDEINRKINEMKKAQTFEKDIDATVVKTEKGANSAITDILNKFQSKITLEIDSAKKVGDIPVEQADQVMKKLKKFGDNLAPEFQTEVDNVIENSLVKTSEKLLEQYRKRLEGLAGELKTDSKISIKPLELMQGSAGNIDIKSMIKTKKVKVGTKEVYNPEKHWWTFWRPKYITVDDIRDKDFINESRLRQEMLTPLQASFFENTDRAIEYVKNQTAFISAYFKQRFKEMNNLLEKKTAELRDYAINEKAAAERVKESEEKLKWLEKITAKVESILEI